MTSLTPAVSKAVDAVRAHFAGKPVEVLPDGAGGANLIIGDIDFGPHYAPSITWLGFQINAAYPSSDVYPLYIGNLLRRIDGEEHHGGGAIQQVTWQDRPALQLSRRSNRWDPAIDTAVLKAVKVIQWMAEQ